MDLTVKDLDYMKITVLGHRKTLLKSIETIKSPPVPIEKIPAPLPNIEKKEENIKKVHWTQVKPISENKVENSSIPVNSGDVVLYNIFSMMKKKVMHLLLKL